ncbi:hypothetical protein OAK82_02210 [Candidatus Thioglobus sp.]|nr:hypothetical protein [Candidatus Thioglobus sp.]
MSVALSKNKVVGSISITKKRLLIDGVNVIGGEVGDSYSLPKARRGTPAEMSSINSNPRSFLNRSIFVRLVSEVQQRAESDGINCIYGTPNKNSYPGYIKRLGYINIENIKYRTYSHYTASFFQKKYSFFGKKSGIFVDFNKNILIGCNNLLSHVLIGKGIDIDHNIPSLDDIDIFWDKVKPASGFSLIRDSKYWEYRYKKNPISEYTFHSIYRHGLMAGIIVSRIRRTTSNLKSVYIAEWMLDKNISLNYCILEVLDFYKKKNIDSFHFISQESDISLINSFGCLFFPRKQVSIIFTDTDFNRSLDKRDTNFDFYLGSTDAV